MIRSLARGLLDLALPPTCADCRAALAPQKATSLGDSLASVLCPGCRSRVAAIARDTCVRCQANRRDELAGHALVCAVCAQRPSQLTSCHASAIYRDAAESWIRKFKYPEPGLAILRPEPQAVAVAMLLDAASRTPGPPPQLVIPVPLHPRRLRERGFNPAAVLARELARKLGIAYASDHLERSRDTPSQTRLSRLERRRNVSGAFTRPPADALPARVWLVDDVVTTGSTLEEAARTLRQGPDRESQLDKLTRKTIEIHAICPCRAAPR